MSVYYPIFLDLRGRRCIVLGGGKVAEEKAEGLLQAGAAVRVIAPRLTPALASRAAAGEIDHLPRRYRDSDLEGAFLAFSERLGEAVHDAVAREADRRDVPLNVQDETRYCSFIAAALVRRGDLTIAISTAGKAPALAVRLRQALERRFGEHYARFLELAGRLRRPLARLHPDFETRRALWYRLVDSDVLRLLEQGEEELARSRIATIMGVEPGGELGR